MSWLELTTRILAGIALILANAFFVAVEFALTRLRQFDRSEIGEGAGIERAWEMTERLEIHLTGCQLGISLTSIVLGIVAEPAISHLLHPVYAVVGLTGGTQTAASVVTAVVLMNFVHKIWGEQTPTYLGVERPVDVANRLAPILYWWNKLGYPLIIAGDSVAKATLKLFGVDMTRSWTEAELPSTETEREEGGYRAAKRQIGEALAGGTFSKDRREEIMRAVEIERDPVSQIMVPRAEIATLSTSHSQSEILDILRETDFTRYPLVGESPDDFQGIVYVPRILTRVDELCRQKLDLKAVANPPLSVPPDMPIADFIDALQANQQEVALVQDDGATVGLVTQTDAFESIIGELEAPFE